MAENKGEKSDVAKREAHGDVARAEEEVLAFWDKNNIFKKSEEKDAPKGEFVFYDGPPFATGLPHYGHILAGTIKDAIPRYWTMRGYRVRRRWGWDCHGLPLENEIEQELGLKTKRDIEELGVAEFNETARKAVLRYAGDWKKIVPRLGRWVDMERDYKTMDASYTESVWWIFKELHDKKLIYQGFKSMHLCPRCGTTLSNFEVNLGYKDVTDFAVTVKLPIEGAENTYLLVWTTTPWTLPGNMAAAIHKDKTYVRIEALVEYDGFEAVKPGADLPQTRRKTEYYLLAKERAEDEMEKKKKDLTGMRLIEWEIIDTFLGEKLINKRYAPPFDYYQNTDIKGKENAWKIYHAPYVSMEEGTGAVHLAPAFGEEDMELAQREGIPLVHHVTRDGVFAPEVSDFAGMPVKPKDTKEEPEKHLSADIEIIKNLAHKGLLFKKAKITHSYPLCWRCDTPLLNYAANSWFVKVTDIREKLVSENNKIRWVPREVGEKRFGNWLENARDWAISRARYWGAPLPVWNNEKTGETVVMGSVADVKKYIKRSGNHYFLMRHGEAESNIKGVSSTNIESKNSLTQKGEEKARLGAKSVRGKRIDLIISSPFERAKATAAIVAKELGLSEKEIIYDERVGEIQLGQMDGVSVDDYHVFLGRDADWSDRKPERGESWKDVKLRVGQLLYELEKSHKGKTILIVAHNSPLRMLEAVARGHALGATFEHDFKGKRFENGEVRELDFVPLPHNEEYELDLHRPYIDELPLEKGGERLVRVPEVFDCWFESGSMPYGQHHYPFEDTDIFDPKGGWFTKVKGYPADFIAEGLDQTRGWFYSLLVLGTALFGQSPYQNVIVNGLVLAEDGQKMSKRLKNYPDPMEMVSRYGADALRYYLLASPVVRGEDLNFSERGVGEVMRKIVIRLSNVLSFYEQSNDGQTSAATVSTSAHVLDRWIMTRLNELISSVTDSMDRYELDRAARPIADFVDDLSTWYLRRSRDRLKMNESTEALDTLRHVLSGFSKVMAPFMPFYAETLHQQIRGADGTESVHLETWPAGGVVDQALLDDMRYTRGVVTEALEKRASAGIKVRQPLRTLVLKDERLAGREELLALIQEEVNVKSVTFDRIIEHAVMLDTTITPELHEEGVLRDFIRAVQDLRKRERLDPRDAATLVVQTDERGQRFLKKHEKALRAAATLRGIQFSEVSGEAMQLGDYTVTLSLVRTQ